MQKDLAPKAMKKTVVELKKVIESLEAEKKASV